MSEENQNLNNEVEVPVPDLSASVNSAPEPTTPPSPATPAVEPEPSVTQPQVIIKKERGFAHYVGFAIIFVLCVCFFFAPGIALTYVLNLVPGVELTGITSWMLSAIFSVVVWLIFKLKIKGFKKSFYFYIGACILILGILVGAEFLTQQTNVFGDILAMLAGGDI
ncbi:MAG: hypothetical protein HUK19_07330 [Fibrobacter sp.]|nr:hypothetical protein [Fibrobacter sp.]